MSAKIIDRRAIKLSDMKPGQIALAVNPVNKLPPYLPIYMRAYTDQRVTGCMPLSMYVELSNGGNQYMDAVVKENPYVVLLEEGQVIELSSSQD